MPIYLSGVNFTDQPFTPSSDGALWNACVTDGVLQGCELSYSGFDLTIAPGWIMAGGKEIHIDTAVTVPITGATSGLARVILTVDLSGTSTEQTFEQVSLSVDYAAEFSGFSALTQGDLAGGDTVYQMALARAALKSTGIYAAVHWRRQGHAKGVNVQYTLPVASWSNNTITVYDSHATADENPIVSPDPSCRAAWRAADVWLDSISENQLVFKCSTTPSAALTANVKYI